MLSNRLDPEELREVILSYQQACTSIIQRFGGTVSRYVGDGILALFGFPRAHEDDAERAVRAALDIVSAMATLSVSDGEGRAQSLAARIGIATGIVVVGDIVGEGAAEEQAVVGETPNLAARLQALAAPNTIVIAAGTRSLVGERFDCADLGECALRGFADPVHVWRVVAARLATSRFEAAQPVRLTALVDRDEFMSWLLGLWLDADRYHGRVALLSGEAGIGKSRVVEAFRERIAAGPYSVVHFQCSPHYINTALHPVIEHIGRAAGIAGEDTPSLKLEKLSSWLGGAVEASDAIPLFAALLSIATGSRFPALTMSPQRQKERTFELLLEYMQRLASTRPLLVVFEDLHWIDPTTQQFLALLVERARDMRVLIVMTFRPGFVHPWTDQSHVEYRELDRLAVEYANGLALNVAGDLLPKDIIEHVVAKTDGVPLFIEELTRALLDTGLRQEQQYAVRTPQALTTIPSTLHDSLMARLDQLGAAKHIAQVAGAIGREFSYELLDSVARETPERLHSGLQVLQRAGLVYADPRAPTSSFVFKHALVQEAAYQSLLRSHRRELHLRIAEALENHFPQTARDTPELLAQHWTEAGEVERAVTAWLAAGKRASERSEYHEAIAHLRRGLDLVPRLTDPQLSRERELALRLALAPVLIISHGGGTPEVGTLYSRALELCEGMPESVTQFVAHWGWWRASMDHRMGRQRADKVLSLARNLREPALLLQAHHCQWATLYMLGAHTECCRHVEEGLALYDPHRDRVDAGLYSGHDARVCGLGEGGLARWIQGYPERARELVDSALKWATDLSHVGSRAHAMDFVLVLQRFRRDMKAVHERASDLIDFAAEQKLRVFSARGAFFRGYARALLEDPAAGLSEMLEGIASAEAADTPHDFPLYYEMLAEIYARAGLVDQGLRAVADAFSVAERHGIVFWNAELHRRRAELLLAGGDRSAAEASLHEALSCARSHEARSLELRAAADLARLHLRDGEPSTVDAVLRPLYQSFEEGFDTADLVDARKVLETQKRST